MSARLLNRLCGGLLFPVFFYPNLKLHPERNIEIAIVGSQLMDDLGLWCNYGQIQRDMVMMYTDGYWKKLLSKEEYDSLPWKKIDDVDASAMQEFLPKIAYTDKVNSVSGWEKQPRLCSNISASL